MVDVPQYRYDARCVRVVDGDTMDLDVDLGFYVTHRIRVRLLGIDTPELRSSDPSERDRARDASLVAANWLARGELISDGRGGWRPLDVSRPLVVETEKTGKFGRWLARIWREGDDVDLAEHLRHAGFGGER